MIETLSITLNCEKLTLLVDHEKNEKAYNLYKKLDFQLENPDDLKIEKLVYMSKTIK